MFKFHNGDKVRDKVTGFEGIIKGRTNWMTGCNTYGIQGPLKDGKILEPEWIDEGQLDLVKQQFIPVSSVMAVEDGGPHPTPKQN